MNRNTEQSSASIDIYAQEIYISDLEIDLTASQEKLTQVLLCLQDQEEMLACNDIYIAILKDDITIYEYENDMMRDMIEVLVPRFNENREDTIERLNHRCIREFCRRLKIESMYEKLKEEHETLKKNVHSHDMYKRSDPRRLIQKQSPPSNHQASILPWDEAMYVQQLIVLNKQLCTLQYHASMLVHETQQLQQYSTYCVLYL